MTPEIEKIEAQIAEARAKLKPINALIDRLHKKSQKLVEAHILTKAEDIKYLLGPVGTVAGPHLNNWLMKIFSAEHKYAMPIRAEGYYPQTMQAGFNIDVGQIKDFSLFEETLSKLLEHIKPIEGFQRFGVSTTDYNASGVVTLHYDPTTKLFQIAKTTYGRERAMFRDITLVQAVEYLKQYNLQYND